MAGGGSGSDGDSVAGGMIALATVLGLLLLHTALHHLDAWAKAHRHIEDMLRSGYRELTTVGLISLVMFLIQSVSALDKSSAEVHEFETLHIMLFILAVVFLFSIVMLVLLSVRIAEQWDATEQAYAFDVDHYAQLKSNFLSLRARLGMPAFNVVTVLPSRQHTTTQAAPTARRGGVCGGALRGLWCAATRRRRCGACGSGEDDAGDGGALSAGDAGGASTPVASASTTKTSAPSLFRWSTLAHPVATYKYVVLLQKIRFLEQRHKFIRRNKLPGDFLFSAYLRKCKQYVFRMLVDIPPAVWITFLFIIALDMYLRAVWPAYSSGMQPATIILILCALVILTTATLYYKMRRVHWAVLHSSYMTQAPSFALAHGRQPTPLELHEAQIEAQKALFWFSHPVLVLRLVQGTIFCGALTIALVYKFWAAVHKLGQVFLPIAIIVAVLIAVFNLRAVVPMYIMTLHTGELVDLRLLIEAVGQQHALEKERRASEFRAAQKAAFEAAFGKPTLRQRTAASLFSGTVRQLIVLIVLLDFVFMAILSSRWLPVAAQYHMFIAEVITSSLLLIDQMLRIWAFGPRRYLCLSIKSSAWHWVEVIAVVSSSVVTYVGFALSRHAVYPNRFNGDAPSSDGHADYPLFEDGKGAATYVGMAVLVRVVRSVLVIHSAAADDEMLQTAACDAFHREVEGLAVSDAASDTGVSGTALSGLSGFPSPTAQTSTSSPHAFGGDQSPSDVAIGMASDAGAAARTKKRGVTILEPAPATAAAPLHVMGVAPPRAPPAHVYAASGGEGDAAAGSMVKHPSVLQIFASTNRAHAPPAQDARFVNEAGSRISASRYHSAGAALGTASGATGAVELDASAALPRVPSFPALRSIAAPPSSTAGSTRNASYSETTLSKVAAEVLATSLIEQAETNAAALHISSSAAGAALLGQRVPTAQVVRAPARGAGHRSLPIALSSSMAAEQAASAYATVAAASHAVDPAQRVRMRQASDIIGSDACAAEGVPVYFDWREPQAMHPALHAVLVAGGMGDYDMGGGSSGGGGAPLPAHGHVRSPARGDVSLEALSSVSDTQSPAFKAGAGGPDHAATAGVAAHGGGGGGGADAVAVDMRPPSAAAGVTAKPTLAGRPLRNIPEEEELTSPMTSAHSRGATQAILLSPQDFIVQETTRHSKLLKELHRRMRGPRDLRAQHNALWLDHASSSESEDSGSDDESTNDTESTRDYGSVAHEYAPSPVSRAPSFAPLMSPRAAYVHRRNNSHRARAAASASASASASAAGVAPAAAGAAATPDAAGGGVASHPATPSPPPDAIKLYLPPRRGSLPGTRVGMGSDADAHAPHRVPVPSLPLPHGAPDGHAVGTDGGMASARAAVPSSGGALLEHGGVLTSHASTRSLGRHRQEGGKAERDAWDLYHHPSRARLDMSALPSTLGPAYQHHLAVVLSEATKMSARTGSAVSLLPAASSDGATPTSPLASGREAPANPKSAGRTTLLSRASFWLPGARRASQPNAATPTMPLTGEASPTLALAVQAAQATARAHAHIHGRVRSLSSVVDGGEVDRERLAAKTVGMLAAAQLAGAVRATLAGGGEKEEGAGGTSVGRHGHSLSRKSSSSLRAWEAAATQVLHHHARSGSAMRAASVHAPRPSHASAAATSTDATASRLQHRTVMDVFSGPQSAAAAAASVAAAAAIDAEARAAAAADAAHHGGGSTLPPHA